MKFEPGDLLRVRDKTTLWLVDEPIGDKHTVGPGDLLVFLGPAPFKFIRVLHPIHGVRRISRGYVTPVQPT